LEAVILILPKEILIEVDILTITTIMQSIIMSIAILHRIPHRILPPIMTTNIITTTTMMTDSIAIEDIFGDIILLMDFQWVIIMTLIIRIGMEGIA
jgi:hypothetical protein